MSGYREWADEPEESVDLLDAYGRRPIRQPEPQLQLQPASPLYYEPIQPRPIVQSMMVQPSSTGRAQLFVPQRPSINYGDPYQAFMAGLPDLLADNGIDLSNGVDAMTLPGGSDGATMSDWKASTRYANGSTDGTGRQSFDEHLRQKYQDSIGAIRNFSHSTPG